MRFSFRGKAMLLQPNGGNKREFYLHEVTVWWKASAIICYHNNTLKHHKLSSPVSLPSFKRACLGVFLPFAALILHWRVQICKLSPGGGYLCLTEGLRWLRRGARLISGLFQKGECVALLWKTAFVRLSCVRTEGKTRQKRWPCLKPTQSCNSCWFFLCLGVCCVFSFSFTQPLFRLHTISHTQKTYFYFPPSSFPAHSLRVKHVARIYVWIIR